MLQAASDLGLLVSWFYGFCCRICAYLEHVSWNAALSSCRVMAFKITDYVFHLMDCTNCDTRLKTVGTIRKSGTRHKLCWVDPLDFLLCSQRIPDPLVSVLIEPDVNNALSQSGRELI